MAFWLTFFLFVGFTAISELLRPKPKFGAPAASGIGDFNIPTAEEGRPIPIVFGTCRIAGPNIVWYGDLLVRPIRKKVKTGLFSSTRITTGYRYYLGMQMVLCHGEVDEILEVRWEDRAVGFTFAPAIHRAQEPAQGGLGLGGTQISPADALDDPVNEFGITDGDVTCEEGPAGSSGSVHGYRFSFGSPKGTVKTGWKIHVVAKKTDAGTIPLDGLELYAGTVWTGSEWPNATFVGGTLVHAEGAHPFGVWLRDIVTTEYDRYTIELSEAEATQLDALGNVSVLIYANANFGTNPTRVRHTQAYLEVPGGSADEPARLLFASPTQWGGDEEGGGVTGQLDFYRGTQTQTSNDYLESLLGDLPGYRGICYAVARQMYLGTSPYLKPMAFVVRRCPNGIGLTDAQANINGDANPAAMLYDILTNDRWGLAIPAASIDVPSFFAAGQVLASEEFGLSMNFDSSGSGRDLMGEILRHIDGVVYTDMQTGKLVLKLARADYGPADPLLLNTDNVKSCKIARPAWGDTKNTVKVRFVDRAANFQDRIAFEQDSANVEITGAISSQDYDYRGISNATLAQKIAARELRTAAFPLAPVELEVNRIAWRLPPGGVARLTWEPLGIVDMPVRVTRISTGELRDGVIKIDAVQDVFGLRGTGFTAPGSSGWVDPVTNPTGLDAAVLLEVPYALVVGPERLVMTLGAQSSSAQLGYEVWADLAGGVEFAFMNQERELTPAPLLANDIGYTESAIKVGVAPGLATLETVSDGDFAAGRHLALIDGELIAFQVIALETSGLYLLANVVRGVADTTPRNHAAGSRVWLLTEGSGLATGAALSGDATLAAKLLAFTSKAVQLLADVSALTLTTTSRALRPYVPRNVLINGSAYPVLVGSGDITVAWGHRNRLAEWSYADGGLTGSPEAGTTYNLRFYDEGDTLVKTYSGLTGTSQTWTTEVADAGHRLSRIRIELEAIVGSLASFQQFDYVVWRDMAQQPDALAIPNPAVQRRTRRFVNRVSNTSSE
jgi:hypothetical protein